MWRLVVILWKVGTFRLHGPMTLFRDTSPKSIKASIVSIVGDMKFIMAQNKLHKIPDTFQLWAVVQVFFNLLAH